MTMINQNFTLFSGDTKYLHVDLTDSNGEAVDLTGMAIKWGVKKNVRTATIFLKTTPTGIDIPDPLNGRFTVKIHPLDTATLSGVFYHEAQITDVEGNVSTVLTGTMTVELDGI